MDVPPRNATVLDVRLGDHLVLRKPHPCGSVAWTVVRLGADIGIRCGSCGRRVVMPRSELESRVRTIERAPSEIAAGEEPA
jgi:hypothetical protein